MKKPTFEDIEEHINDDDHSGWCTNCGDWTHDFCEPDASKYGAEELLIENLFE